MAERLHVPAAFARAGVAGVAASAFLFSGCGDGRPPTAAVRGTVTFDGSPLTTGTVTFIPDPSGPFASGEIGPDGTYRLTTFDDGDGAVLGRHRVMVSAVKFAPDAPAVPLIPSKYGSDRTSGLTAEVTDGENVADLTLGRK